MDMLVLCFKYSLPIVIIRVVYNNTEHIKHKTTHYANAIANLGDSDASMQRYLLKLAGLKRHLKYCLFMFTSKMDITIATITHHPVLKTNQTQHTMNKQESTLNRSYW